MKYFSVALSIIFWIVIIFLLTEINTLKSNQDQCFNWVVKMKGQVIHKGHYLKATSTMLVNACSDGSYKEAIRVLELY